jgi:hypothetical protein
MPFDTVDKSILPKVLNRLGDSAATDMCAAGYGLQAWKRFVPFIHAHSDITVYREVGAAYRRILQHLVLYLEPAAG